MLSKYSKMLNKINYFTKQKENILVELKDKKVLVYGCGSAFVELDKQYNFLKDLNIIAISDKKFETQPVDYKGIKAISPNDIKNLEFDNVLITNESAYPIKQFLQNSLSISTDKIISLYPDEIKDEPALFMFAEEYNFKKYLNHLNKKLKNKTVIIYGAGDFFKVISKYYDLSKLNIIAVCDKKFQNHTACETFLDYKVCAPEEIKGLNPDYVLVATKFYVNLIEEIWENLLSGTKIKIKALIKKPLRVLLKEIWGK